MGSGGVSPQNERAVVLQRIPEIVLGHTGLFEDAAQCSLADFIVHGHNATGVPSTKNGVAALLPDKRKA
jgi:hypothetical protein